MMHIPRLEEVVRRNPRYAYEAYEFVFAALAHTQILLGRVPPEKETPTEGDFHVSGRELLDGIRDLALKEFGLMARIVFHMWGIDRTDDFGEIVFNLVESGLMSKTSRDDRADFVNVYDLDKVLVDDFRLEWEESK